MTSCDKILNQDVLTRNRCHGGATSLCGTWLACVCQEPVSNTLDLLCICFGSSALWVLRAKTQSPERWAMCPTSMISPCPSGSYTHPSWPVHLKLHVGGSNDELKNLSSFLLFNISGTLQIGPWGYDWFSSPSWIQLSFLSLMTWLLLLYLTAQPLPLPTCHGQLHWLHFPFNLNPKLPSGHGSSFSRCDNFLAN